MDYQEIRVTYEDGTCYMQINRPYAANKLNIRCMDELCEAFAAAECDAGCHSVVIYGNQDIFCSGGELGDFRKKGIAEIKAFGAAFIALHLAIQNCPVPVIAAVEGDALGGGLSLVEACDLAIGAESAWFAIPEILDGLAPAMGLSGIFGNLGKKQVMELGLLGKVLSAQEALELGLLNEVASKVDVLEHAALLAHSFAGRNPTAIRLFKELYADMGMHAYESRLKMGRSMMIELFKSRDGAESLASKEENRVPTWCGE